MGLQWAKDGVRGENKCREFKANCSVMYWVKDNIKYCEMKYNSFLYHYRNNHKVDWLIFWNFSVEDLQTMPLQHQWNITSSYKSICMMSTPCRLKCSTRTYMWWASYIFSLLTWQSLLRADKRPLVLLRVAVCEGGISHASLDDYIALSICLPLEGRGDELQLPPSP